MSDVRRRRVSVGGDGGDDLPEDIAEVVGTYRDTFELVAEGDDESARMARKILEKADNKDGE